MCASLLRQFGIKEVYFGAGNEKFGGNGGVLDVHLGNGRFTEIDREARRQGKRKKGEGDYEVSGGWLREDAILMLRRFYVQENGRGEFSLLVLRRGWDLRTDRWDSSGTESEEREGAEAGDSAVEGPDVGFD